MYCDQQTPRITVDELNFRQIYPTSSPLSVRAQAHKHIYLAQVFLPLIIVIIIIIAEGLFFRFCYFFSS